jgi:hypothetical protein
VGNLWQMTTGESGYFRNDDLPVIVATRGYRAYSSEGHVEVIANHRGNHTRQRQLVVGIQGFPWMKAKGLRPMGNPMEVLILRPGTHVRRLETHAGRGSGPYPAWHSNVATAGAAAEGVQLMARIRPNSVFVMEGQSDYEQGWELSAQWDRYESEPGFVPEWPEEHRGDLFTDEALLAAALRRKAFSSGGRPVDSLGRLFVYLNLLIGDDRSFWSDGKGWVDQLVPATVIQMVGGGQLERERILAQTMGEADSDLEVIKTIVLPLVDAMRQEGWKLLVDDSVANHFLVPVAPDGEVLAAGFGLVHGPKEYEATMIGLSDLSDEEKEALLAKLEAQDRESRYWIAKVGA